MKICLTEDQLEIERQARRFCEKETPLDYARKMSEASRGYEDAVWKKMVKMGWPAMRIPEAYGGLGLSLLDMTVVLKEMGRTLTPGPFFSSCSLAAEIVLEMGNDAQKDDYLRRMASGEIRGTLAIHEEESGGDLGYIHMIARPHGDGFALNGKKLFVIDAHTADFLICPARTGNHSEDSQGITVFLVDLPNIGVKTELLPAMDGTRKLCAVEFDGAIIPATAVLGEMDGGFAPLMKSLQKSLVCLAAESLGGAEKALLMASEYSKVRYQFDRPIGSFQAIKHYCSEMYVGVESARSVLNWAAWAQDHADPKEARIAASAAKVYCTEVFKNASAKTIQILGGIGFTWEHDAHLYLKRAKSNEAALGDSWYHRERIMQLIEN